VGEEWGREAGQTGGGGLWKGSWCALLLPGGGLGCPEAHWKDLFPQKPGCEPVTHPRESRKSIGQAEGRQVTTPTAPALS